MAAIVFDGKEFARRRELELAQKIRSNRLAPRIGSVVFSEDQASVMYTGLKKQAAVRVGVEFSVQELSMKEEVTVVRDKIGIYSDRDDIDGVLVQKPMKTTWEQLYGKSADRFEPWWDSIVNTITTEKDVDCLTEPSLARVYDGSWKILPATVKAIITILHECYLKSELFHNKYPGFDLHEFDVVVVGRSEIVGRPLAAVMEQYGGRVSLYGSDLDPQALARADLVVSATGVEGLIKAQMLKEGVAVVDVGAPNGDVDFGQVVKKAAFVTPVPGGVGPVTVVSLLENLVELMQQS